MRSRNVDVVMSEMLGGAAQMLEIPGSIAGFTKKTWRMLLSIPWT
jgi:hypothetical protein